MSSEIFDEFQFDTDKAFLVQPGYSGYSVVTCSVCIRLEWHFRFVTTKVKQAQDMNRIA